MKPAHRWPLHPAPKEGEALSSWLNRIAGCYQMNGHDLLEHDLGHGQVNDLDLAPPLSLLTALAQRSGVGLERLHCMSFSCWMPWLLDSLDDEVTSALETYVFQFSVLLPKKNRKVRHIASWRAWLPMQSIHRACPICLNDSVDHPILLAWQLPLMLSCPTHGCWLEPYLGGPWQFMCWETKSCEPREASEPILVMDRRTWQALTAGCVELPRRRVHAGLWFRLLRTLLDELNTPLSYCGSYGRDIRYVWEQSGYPLRAKQTLWHPYESLNTSVQLQMLEAAATAIHLVESRMLSPYGEQAELFLTEPQTKFINGLQPTDTGKNEPINYWREAAKAIEEAIIEARHNPEAARSLFWLASYGQHDPDYLKQLHALFTEVKIPLEFLSHYDHK
ncbi:TniQ family protein (plasmid) [Candidatus Fukatsuia symbiotica]|uniref:Transposase n=1 Tax=Candidatus Fukatsuia symbiotica TaxID=1878942 RepID=A0A2U8IB31_9GAMM|nr:TniQ family protein [Candidatus Fukatsuia symbiotica]AWK15112.1 transposase [Candidatus Fukatsuia symbiotica]AWK15544.1 transposase [Candidatus Fukatsuia symbiotica]MEA9443927.1 TniQ family protein [Candidatus Fukatsuia symbiotica]MEA9445934.1 TniQ family protein [Candidatus Fukatsuia symbiotica]